METKKTCHAIATVCQVDLQNGRKRKANSKRKQEVGLCIWGFLIARKTRHWEEKNTAGKTFKLLVQQRIKQRHVSYRCQNHVSLRSGFPTFHVHFDIMVWPVRFRTLWLHTKQSLEWRTGQGHAAATPSRIMVTLHTPSTETVHIWSSNMSNIFTSVHIRSHHHHHPNPFSPFSVLPGPMLLRDPEVPGCRKPIVTIADLTSENQDFRNEMWWSFDAHQEYESENIGS